MRGVPHATRFAECAVTEHAEREHVVQPMPQPCCGRHGARDERGIVGAVALHKLPHVHPWVKHESGVSQVMDPRRVIQMLATERRTGTNMCTRFSGRRFFKVRLYMMHIGWFSRLSQQQPSPRRLRRIAARIGVAHLLIMTGAAVAQDSTPESKMTTPNGYVLHQSVDLGGRIANP